MKLREYKIIFMVALLLVGHPLIAQTLPPVPVPPPVPAPPVVIDRQEKTEKKFLNKQDFNLNLKEDLDLKLKDLTICLNSKDFKIDLSESLKIDLSEIEFKDMPEMKFEMNTDFENFDKVQQSNNTVEKVKKITKTYNVNNKDKLSINNQYGKVEINVWAKNEIKVEIDIRAYGSSDDEATKLLEGVDINESKTTDLISFKTNITGSPNGWWGTKRGRDDNDERKGLLIDYTVYMPGRNALNIVNKFGSITLPDFDGAVNIQNSYGSFNAANLKNTSNVIDVKYGSAKVAKLVSGTINVAYGSLNIDEARQINADVRYGSTKIKKLSSGGNLENKYGSIKIDELDDLVKKLIITTDKGSVTMGIKQPSNFDFDVTVNMGGFHYPDDKMKITSQTPDEEGWKPQFTKNYKGTCGKGSDAQILIKSSFGSVRFD